MGKLKIIVAGIICFISVIIMGAIVYFLFFGKNEMLYLASLLNLHDETVLNMSMILFFLGSGGFVLFTLDYLVNA